jgi:hypothetical protein
MITMIQDTDTSILNHSNFISSVKGGDLLQKEIATKVKKEESGFHNFSSQDLNYNIVPIKLK